MTVCVLILAEIIQKCMLAELVLNQVRQFMNTLMCLTTMYSMNSERESGRCAYSRFGLKVYVYVLILNFYLAVSAKIWLR